MTKERSKKALSTCLILLCLTPLGNSLFGQDKLQVELAFCIESDLYRSNMPSQIDSLQTSLSEGLASEYYGKVASFGFVDWVPNVELCNDSLSNSPALKVLLKEEITQTGLTVSLGLAWGSEEFSHNDPCLLGPVLFGLLGSSCDSFGISPDDEFFSHSRIDLENQIRLALQKQSTHGDFQESLMDNFLSEIPLSNELSLEGNVGQVLLPFSTQAMNAEEAQFKAKFETQQDGLTLEGKVEMEKIGSLGDKMVCRPTHFKYSNLNFLDPNSDEQWAEMKSVLTSPIVSSVSVHIERYVRKRFSGSLDTSL